MSLPNLPMQIFRIGTVDVLKACDACADMGSYSAVYRFGSLSIDASESTKPTEPRLEHSAHY